MIITLSWLKDHLITNANLEKIIDKAVQKFNKDIKLNRFPKNRNSF